MPYTSFHHYFGEIAKAETRTRTVMHEDDVVPRRNDPQIIRELKGPVLNPGSPQSKHAPAVLKLVKDVVLSDPAYIERLKRHSQMFKEKVTPKHFRKSDAAKRVEITKPKSKRQT